MIGAAVGVLAGMVVPAVIGVCLLRLVARSEGWARLTFELPVGLALGLGVTGALSFLGFVISDRPTVLLELGLLFALLWARRRTDAPALLAPERSPGGWRRTAGAAALVIVGAAAVVWASEAWTMDHGAWDAWDIWNMRARFLYRAGEGWERAFAETLHWAHPHYPPLWPSAVARGFALAGHESTWVPRAMGLVFTVATVALLAATVTRARGAAQGTLAALTLVATPFFVRHGASQYADVPIAFFFLATFAFMAWHDEARSGRGFMVLAGLSASLALLTKNEGAIVLVGVIASRAWIAGRRGGRARLWREATAFGAGALPGAGLWLLFKLSYAHTAVNYDFFVPDPVFHHGVGPMEFLTTQLNDPVRWRGMATAWGRWILDFDDGWPVPLTLGLAVYAAVMGRTARPPLGVAGALAIWALILSLAFVAWSRWEIVDHMDALQRLMIQLLPTALLGFFLTVRAPFEIPDDRR